MTILSTKDEIVTANSDDEHAALGAELMARAIEEAVRTRGRAFVALSGGSTPGPIYRRLAQYALPLDRIDWFWVDERSVSPNHLRSNFRSVTEDLQLGRADAARVHRLAADAQDLAEAAKQYESLLRRTFGIAKAVAFDVLTLGVGDDGHTASLFPGTGAVAIDDRLVAAIDAQPALGLEARLSMTAPLICEARFVLVLVRGASKRKAVAAAFMDGPDDAVPARLLRRAQGQVTWLVDQEVRPMS